MFRCEYCNFSTTLSANYKRHLDTKKHKKNIDGTNNTVFEKMSQNEPKRAKKSQNEPKRAKNEQIYTKKVSSEHQCNLCSKSFKTKANLRRHELHRCKKNPELNCNFKKLYQQSEKEKKMLHGQIEKMLEQNGKIIQNISNSQIINNNNSNNKIINNITLNNYGSEDLSHLTDNVLDNLIMGPGSMISKLLEIIHFNTSKPENMNMFIPNKRDKYIKTYIENEWKLEEKKDRIPQLLEKSYSLLDDHYENNEERYSSFNKKFYKKIQEGIDNQDKEILKQQKELLELSILNGSQKFKDKFIEGNKD